MRTRQVATSFRGQTPAGRRETNPLDNAWAFITSRLSRLHIEVSVVTVALLPLVQAAISDIKGHRMIDLYTWTTPNGRKVSILLEELGIKYAVKPIDITNGQQNTPEYLAINPNNKIPAIVDHDSGITLFESGAVMLYLADKYRRFIPEDSLGRWNTIQWLMWQMGGVGPILGQVHHFVYFNPNKSAYAEEHFSKEGRRLYGVLETLLTSRDFVAGNYSIADMALWPWVSRFEWQKIDLTDFPHVKSWYLRIADRAPVQRGYDVPSKVAKIPPLNLRSVRLKAAASMTAF
jgi:GSH-dependent disulfide-bond oxidoreductase